MKATLGTMIAIAVAFCLPGDSAAEPGNGSGAVVAWGWNNYGQTTVPANATNIVAIAGGARHSLALRADGTVVAWGYNDWGQANVPLDATNIVAIAGGYGHSLVLRANGAVVAWGGYYNGAAYVPMVAPTGLTNVVEVEAGWSHSLALIASGPLIWPRPPPTITLAHGASVALTFSVKQKGPFNSQWFFNGVPIGAATDTNLVVSGFGFTDAGAYSVAVSNQFGNALAVTVLRLPNSPVVLLDGVDVGGGSVARIDSTQITMTNTGSGAAIYYTLDGSTPDFTKILYAGPFTLTNNAAIRTIAYNSGYTDSAQAAPITVQVWPTYPLSVTTPGGGSIALSPGAYSAGNRYVSNTVVTLTATPSNNWSFLGWTGDSSATNNVTTVLMDRPRTVQGVFGTSLNPFINGSGQVQLNPPTGPYAFGSTVKLTALPAAGYYFFGWANAASGSSNPLTFTVTNASGITALFGALAANQVSLVILPNGTGTVSVNPSRNVYTNDETVTLTALPAANQIFTGWSDDASGNLNPLILTLSTSKLITANFAPGSPTNPPVITQPALSRTLSAGANTLLSFQLTGDGPFSYQWRLNSSPVSGATNPTLTLTGVTPAQAGRYDVVVVGSSGVATSAPAAVALFGLEMVVSNSQPHPLLTLDCAPGTSFRLEHSWDLSLTNWNLLAPVTLTGSRLNYVDTPDTNHFMRFYRAVPQ